MRTGLSVVDCLIKRGALGGIKTQALKPPQIGVTCFLDSVLPRENVGRMIAATFERNLREWSQRTPFRPFEIELVSGSRFMVDHPEALIYRGGTAVYVALDGTSTLFDHESVSRLEGPPGSQS